METQNKDTVVYEDEINLYDYWKVIVKRKRLIIGLFLVATIAVGIISLRMPKVYKAMTVLEIGKTTGLLEDLKQVKTKIETVYPFKTISRLNIPEEEFPKIKTEIPKNTSFVNIAIESPKPEFAVKILDDIVKQVMEEHGSLISNFKIGMDNQIKALDSQIYLFKKERETVLSNFKIGMDNQIKALDSQIYLFKKERETVFSKIKINEKNKADLQGRIRKVDSRTQSLLEEKNRLNLQANPDSALSNFLFTNEMQLSQRYRNELEDRLNISLPKEELGLKMELERIEKDIKEIERGKELLKIEDAEVRMKIERIEKDIKEIERGKELLQNQINAIQDTKAIKPTSYSKFPIKPSIKKNIALTGITSLFAGIFLAFFMEYVERMRS